MTDQADQVERTPRQSEDLPPPGPVYVISETGFGPSGLYKTDPVYWKKQRRWKYVPWFTKRVPDEV